MESTACTVACSSCQIACSIRLKSQLARTGRSMLSVMLTLYTSLCRFTLVWPSNSLETTSMLTCRPSPYTSVTSTLSASKLLVMLSFICCISSDEICPCSCDGVSWLAALAKVPEQRLCVRGAKAGDLHTHWGRGRCPCTDVVKLEEKGRVAEGKTRPETTKCIRGARHTRP